MFSRFRLPDSQAAIAYRRMEGSRSASMHFETQDPARTVPDLTVVIPVFNGAATVASVVEEVIAELGALDLEIVLVNDGSKDQSQAVCEELVRKYPRQVAAIELARNFGEHNAVMAGLRAARGQYAAVVDDDGQHPAVEIGRMLEEAKRRRLDVVSGRFRTRQHSVLRVLESRLANAAMDILLQKPRGLYLSSFKVMSRFVIDQICRYQGPTPYVDGLMLRVTDRIGQLEVEHRPRAAGRSGYTFSRLFSLWLGIAVEYSTAPFRAAILGGVLTAFVGILLAGVLLVAMVAGEHNPSGLAWAASAGLGVAGVLISALGMAFEYAARLMRHASGMPQHVVRTQTRSDDGEPLSEREEEKDAHRFPRPISSV